MNSPCCYFIPLLSNFTGSAGEAYLLMAPTPNPAHFYNKTEENNLIKRAGLCTNFSYEITEPYSARGAGERNFKRTFLPFESCMA